MFQELHYRIYFESGQSRFQTGLRTTKRRVAFVSAIDSFDLYCLYVNHVRAYLACLEQSMARIINRPSALSETTRFARLIKERSQNRYDYEIEAALTGDKQANGRKFMRWRNGISALTPSKLQSYRDRAVELGWLPKRELSCITRPDERFSGEDGRYLRVEGQPPKSAGEWIKDHREPIRRLERTRAAAVTALSKLRDAIKGANEVIIFDTGVIPKIPDKDACRDDKTKHAISLDTEFVQKNAQQMIDQIAGLCFHDISPWAQRSD